MNKVVQSPSALSHDYLDAIKAVDTDESILAQSLVVADKRDQAWISLLDWFVDHIQQLASSIDDDASLSDGMRKIRYDILALIIDPIKFDSVGISSCSLGGEALIDFFKGGSHTGVDAQTACAIAQGRRPRAGGRGAAGGRTARRQIVAGAVCVARKYGGDQPEVEPKKVCSEEGQTNGEEARSRPAAACAHRQKAARHGDQRCNAVLPEC